LIVALGVHAAWLAAFSEIDATLLKAFNSALSDPKPLRRWRRHARTLQLVQLEGICIWCENIRLLFYRGNKILCCCTQHGPDANGGNNCQ
jgi:hypothetical protein